MREAADRFFRPANVRINPYECESDGRALS
jgi:hypothetical protein